MAFFLLCVIADRRASQVTNAIKFTRKEAIRNINVVLAASKQRPDRSLNGKVYLDFPISRDRNHEADSAPNEDEVFIMISVSDTGCGIKVEELENIFLRFQQSSPKTYGEMHRHHLYHD